MTSKLNGLKILVTRPAHQAEPLCTLIKDHGGQPVRLPTIEIVPIPDRTPLIECRNKLYRFEAAIFVSANAVDYSLPTLLQEGPLPTHLLLIGVGIRTVEAIIAKGQLALCPPPPFNSEAVLTLPQLQAPRVNKRHILIVRGEGGRDLLATTLQQRGATVHHVEVYRRLLPSRDGTQKGIISTDTPLNGDLQDKIDIMIVTSVDGLRNLFVLLEGEPWLCHTPLVVIGQRLVAQALQLGIKAPIFVAPEASDEGLLEATLQAASGMIAAGTPE